jgi:RNA polymerase sigma-70 factor (ECF subfamily)
MALTKDHARKPTLENDSGAPATHTRADDRALHQRLIDRDLLALTDLAMTYLDPLIQYLERRFPRTDPQLLTEAAEEAILGLTKRPTQYDPARSGLATYLRMSARGDALNALRDQRRRWDHEAPLEDVEIAQLAGNRGREETDDPAEMVLRAAALSPEARALIRGEFDGREWQVVQLMIDDERSYQPYIPILDLGYLSEIEQAREVKRVKDRLKLRLKRLAPRIQLDD